MTAPTAPTTPLPSRLAGVLLGLLGLALCATFAAYLLVRHVAWPRLDAWRPWLVAQVERQLGVPVSIDALHPDWEGLHPSLRIDGLRIDGPDGAPRLAVGSAFARVSWRHRGKIRAYALDNAGTRIGQAKLELLPEGAGAALVIDAKTPAFHWELVVE